MRHEGLPILCKAASAPFINAIGNSTADNNDSKEKFGDELQLIHDKVSKIIGSNTASHRPNEGGHKIQKGITFEHVKSLIGSRFERGETIEDVAPKMAANLIQELVCNKCSHKRNENNFWKGKIPFIS